MTRECTGCGKEFETNDLRQRKCRKDCGRTNRHRNSSRTSSRLAHVVQFIAVDGEADTTLPGDPYVLLSIGNRSLSRNGQRLTHHDIFPFLWDCHRDNPGAAFVGFFLGYDFAQWLKSISKHEALMLLSPEGIAKRSRKKSGGNPLPFPVYIGDEWEIDILGNKRFKLRPKGSKDPWMYVCDAGSFFQTSLLNAINPNQWPDSPVCTPEEYAVVVAGKTTRDDAAFGEEMIKYNVLENAILERMMERLNTGFTAIGVRLDRNKWFGPGQAAQAWMSDNGMPTSVEIQEAVPKEVLDLGRQSFFGGWFEIMMHGHLPGETYEYDINSAYPHAMRSLPCLLHGEWRAFGKRRTVPSERYGLVRARVYGSDPHIGTMLHRESKQTILRPHITTGVYWAHELKAAMRAGVVDRVAIESGYTYSPCQCPPPMRGVAELYEQRLQFGKETVHGKACKLVYNSMYGKTAQSVGAPKFANSIYASMITSECRTMILDAIATHPEGTAAVAMVATDGVYFRSPHPGLELSANELGKWDSSVLHNLTLLKPGVYWHDGTRENIAKKEGFKLKSRGISARDLGNRIAEFDTAFTSFTGTDTDWPSLLVNVAFSVLSAKSALHRNNWGDCGASIRDKEVVVNSNPRGKRDVSGLRKERGVWRTDVYAVPPSGVLESVPYNKTFGVEDEDRDLEGLTPDGDVMAVLTSIMRE